MFGNSYDDRHTVIGTGLITPALFALAGASCLLFGKAYVPGPAGSRHRLTVHVFTSDDWRFWCVMAATFGIALALFGWFGLANMKRTEPLARPVTALGVVGIMIGVAAMILNIIGWPH